MNKTAKSIYRKLIHFTWISFVICIVFFGGYLWMVSENSMNLFGSMPSFDELENPKSELASEVYTSDGVLLGKYFRSNRSEVSYNQLSPNLINALKATEDARFEEHSGIDLTGLLRVAVKSILLRNTSSGGGSTISQQLAKNLFSTRSKKYECRLSKLPLIGKVVVKTKEWVLSVKLERTYTKEEIMTMYLNTVDFGSNSFGIKTAAKTFFQTTPDSLKVEEAAVLVGLLKAPTQYSPITNPAAALGRRNTVIDQMLKYNYLVSKQADSLSKLGLGLHYEVENHNTGLATYFRSVITDYLISWCKERGYDLYSDGLRIYTTIDSRMQHYAEEAVNKQMSDIQGKFLSQWKGKNPWVYENDKHVIREIPRFVENAAKKTDSWKSLKIKFDGDTVAMGKEMKKPIPMTIFSWKGEIDTMMSPIDSVRWYKKYLHCGFMAMDPNTGYIKSWVGGINHKHFKYDHVKQGTRQPGSTFKPFVYSAAVDLGYSPCYEVMDAPVTFETEDVNETWTPQNASGEGFTGEVFTIRKAMANSINSVTAYMMKKVGPQNVVDYAKRMGITTPLEAVPALCLGVNDVSLYDMVGAYATFVNKGVWTEPIYLVRIEDKNGETIQEFVPQTREALSEQTAYLMVHMLKGATQEHGGTLLGLNKYGLLWNGAEIGGKTGTTQNYSDGWFMGITTRIVAGAWVGGDDRAIHFRTMDTGQGARTAMPIWAYFMQNVFGDK